MHFKTIEKTRYNNQLKKIFFAICVYMLVIGVGFSTLLIHFFAFSDGDNFWLNASGAIIAAMSVGLLFAKFKSHPYLEDIVYIRSLKAQLNYIYRKQHKIKIAAQGGDATAMAILDYSYQTSKFVYQLDNNTLTIDDINSAQQELAALASKFQIERYENYHQDLLKAY